MSYRYFMHKTVAQSPEQVKHFGYELESSKDFFFIWGQSLLILVTLGIYFPWAVSKIGSRVLEKTYLEVN